MTELLKRWHEHEPGRCLIGPPTSHLCASVVLGRADFLVQFDRPTPAQIAMLFAAVIEAIEARALSPWHLSRDEDGYAATLTQYQDGIPYGVHGPEAPTPAAALLTAYLAALEAEADQ